MSSSKSSRTRKRKTSCQSPPHQQIANLYDDPKPWAAQSSAVFTLLSFINCQKYPPSLCYLLVTLGPALLFLGLFDRGTPRLLRPLLVFGRVPMFFYLLHLPLIHGLAVLMNRMRFGGPLGSSHAPAHAGVGLFGIYAVWIGVVLALYPACRWFADLKRRRRDVWLSYF